MLSVRVGKPQGALPTLAINIFIWIWIKFYLWEIQQYKFIAYHYNDGSVEI